MDMTAVVSKVGCLTVVANKIIGFLGIWLIQAYFEILVLVVAIVKF